MILPADFPIGFTTLCPRVLAYFSAAEIPFTSGTFWYRRANRQFMRGLLYCKPPGKAVSRYYGLHQRQLDAIEPLGCRNRLRKDNGRDMHRAAEE